MGKKHPLDIFRTTPTGFDSASRDRRTLPGKVVASTPRPGAGAADAAARSDHSAAPGRAQLERGAPLISAARAAAAARAQERADSARVHSSAAIAAMPTRGPAPAAGKPASKPASKRAASGASSRGAGLSGSVNRVLLYSALVIVAGFGIYLVGVNSSGGAALKSSASVGGHYAVVAATWDGSAAGKTAATACGDVLRKAGFPEVRVLGYPSAKAGEFKSYDLLVGTAGDKADLNRLLAQLGALKNSKGEAAFAAPRIAPAPTVAPR